MSSRAATPAPAQCELRVGGHLDEHWAGWFDGLTLLREDDGTTRLRGAVTDQAELYGLLVRVRDIGATLLSVSTTDTGGCHDGRMTSPLDAMDWPARTDRLTIRPATMDDLEAIWAYRRLEEVTRWLTRAPATIEEFRPHLEEPTSLAKTLVIELDGEVIGELMLQIDDAWAQAEVEEQAAGVQAELGWVLHPDHAGHGYATEAVRELIRLCFEVLGLRRVTANCFADNGASARLMQRVGMRLEIHTLRESLHRSGEWLDGMGYALLADEWVGRA
jgi:RimJ/RimL family protein N-acetyltransferase